MIVVHDHEADDPDLWLTGNEYPGRMQPAIRSDRRGWPNGTPAVEDRVVLEEKTPR